MEKPKKRMVARGSPPQVFGHLIIGHIVEMEDNGVGP